MRKRWELGGRVGFLENFTAVVDDEDANSVVGPDYGAGHGQSEQSRVTQQGKSSGFKGSCTVAHL